MGHTALLGSLLHLGMIYSARAVHDLCHALHPGNRQPTLSPTHNCCLSVKDFVGVSRQNRCKAIPIQGAPSSKSIAQEHEKDSDLSKFLHIGCLRTKCDFCVLTSRIVFFPLKLAQRHEICGGTNKTVPFATGSDSSPPHSTSSCTS